MHDKIFRAQRVCPGYRRHSSGLCSGWSDSHMHDAGAAASFFRTVEGASVCDIGGSHNSPEVSGQGWLFDEPDAHV